MTKSKMKTIWHYGMMFFQNHYDMEDVAYEVKKVAYMGSIENLSYKKALKFAQLHPNCLKYYEAAMMPLFQGKGKFSTGTEDPVMALESYKTPKESEIDMPYILIWKLI